MVKDTGLRIVRINKLYQVRAKGEDEGEVEAAGGGNECMFVHWQRRHRILHSES